MVIHCLVPLRALLCWVDLLALVGPLLVVAFRRHPLPRRLRLVLVWAPPLLVLVGVLPLLEDPASLYLT